jgi:hypothetical protein
MTGVPCVVKIVLSKFGDVSDERVGEVTKILEECYERLEPRDLPLVDLYLFATSRSLKSFLFRERSMAGVVSTPIDESFYAMHDAWRGIPRIIVCFERMNELPELVQVGVLRHEAAHSVLHGSLEYYIFPIPQTLVEASEKFAFSKNFTLDLLYLISIAVKDFEVTRLLVKKGYLDDQVAYLRFLLSTSREDLTAWKIVEKSPAGMALCLTGRLKELACASALRPKFGDSRIDEWIRDELSYLPENLLASVMKIVSEFPKFAKGNTFENVEEVTKMLVENLVEPLFES